MFPEVGQQTAVGHEGHHNIGRLSTINTHSYQSHHIGMVELRHLQTLFNHIVKFACTEHSYCNITIDNAQIFVYIYIMLVEVSVE